MVTNQLPGQLSFVIQSLSQDGSGATPVDPADYKLIRQALKRARSHARSLIYGGLRDLFNNCTEALEALDRLEGKAK